MRLRNIKGADDIVSNDIYVIKNPHKYKSKWYKVFNNKHKIEIDLGCGKGDFICKKAIKNPKTNYIGIEKYASVLLFALKKVKKYKLKNVKFILIDGKEIDNLFYKEIHKLYLNFSDPWPKRRHESRRLTSDIFLNKYNNIFKHFKIIEQKTDNKEFFKYSKNNFKKNNYFIIKESHNYNDKYKTEYENKFKNKNIKYVKVIKFI